MVTNLVTVSKTSSLIVANKKKDHHSTLGSAVTVADTALTPKLQSNRKNEVKAYEKINTK